MSLDTAELAGRAAKLSSELYTLQETCNHAVTSTEISSIADELARLSTTLWLLHEAMSADSSQYTPAFRQDLSEITTELSLVLEEISECCSEMQKTDPVDSPVPWFFKKGRVARLTKHLEALKGTLAVMRSVLWYGKEYGAQSSASKSEETYPRTMHEDRIILESLLARNRNAIMELHKLDPLVANHNETASAENTVNSEFVPGSMAWLNNTTNIPPIPDVVPPVTEDKARNMDKDKLERTFSKRGVRLGIHMSILDLNAHEAPTGLKRKWIQQSQLRRSKGEQISNDEQDECLTALPELSRISEVDTNASKTTVKEPDNQDSIPLSPVKSVTVEPSETFIASPVPKPIRRSIDHPSIGQSIKNVMRRFSMTSIRPSPDTGDKIKACEKGVLNDSSEVSSSKTTESDISRQTSRDAGQNGKSKKRMFLKVVSKPFQPLSPLNTPDVEREFENGGYF